MGLDISHGTWHGAYSSFHRWRVKIAKCLGIPLDLMEGFYPTSEMATDQLNQHAEKFPLLWDAFKPSPLHELLYHSDCDGEIDWQNCAAIADALEELLPELTENLGGHVGDMRVKTETFIKGLRLAYFKRENILFQ